MTGTTSLEQTGLWGHWNRFWFPEGSTLRLAICRILIVGGALLLFSPPFGSFRDLLEQGGPFIEPQLLIVAISWLVPPDTVFSVEGFRIVYWVTAAAGLSCLIGFRTRTSAFVFALGQWIFVSYEYSFGEEHHPEALTCIFLMLLAFSPSGARLSVDALLNRRRAPASARPTTTKAFWPLRLTQVLLALSYGSNGVAKLLYGGLDWMNGVTLQQYLLTDALRWDRPVGIWMVQHDGLMVLLSVATILFEVFFFLTLFWPRAVPWFLLGGLALHTGTFVTMHADFSQHLLLYVVFIDFERLWARVRRSAPIGALVGGFARAPLEARGSPRKNAG